MDSPPSSKRSTAKLAKRRENEESQIGVCYAQTHFLVRVLSRVSRSDQVFAFEKSDVASGEQTKEIHRETREKARK
jgi:hypothetical protein